MSHTFIHPNWAKLAQRGIYPENPEAKKEVKKIEKAQEKIEEIEEKVVEQEKEELIFCPICADNKIKMGFKSQGGLRLHLLGKHKLSKNKAAKLIEKVVKAS